MSEPSNPVRTSEYAVSDIHKHPPALIDTFSILAIDSAFDKCSVGLSTSVIRSIQSSNQPRKHADEVLTMVQSILNQHDLALSSINAIAMISGPGSFTGLRIGAAVTQGLAFGAGCQVVCVSSLAIMAFDSLRKRDQKNTSEITLIAVCVHARESEFYFAVYSSDEAGFPTGKLPDQMLDVRQLKTTLEDLAISEVSHSRPLRWIASGAGWGHALLADLKTPFIEHDFNPSCDALLLADLATHQFHTGGGLSPEYALPVYLNDDLHYATV